MDWNPVFLNLQCTSWEIQKACVLMISIEFKTNENCTWTLTLKRMFLVSLGGEGSTTRSSDCWLYWPVRTPSTCTYTTISVVDLTYVTKLVEDSQKNLECVKESVEDYRMMSTVLLEKAAPCNVLMYWAKHILQPPPPINRWFSVFRSILYNSKTLYFQHWSEKRTISESCKSVYYLQYYM